MRGLAFIAAFGAALALTACNQPDVRAAQQSECEAKKGHYIIGQDWDDDVCVVTRDGAAPTEVILFDDREPGEE